MKKTIKKKLLVFFGISAIAAPIISVATYFGIEENKANVINNHKNIINNIINNNSSIEINSNFIKGADVSSYADVIENFLFENNIKKGDNEWYSYKDIQNTNNKVWNPKTNTEVSLLEYINDNLFSYFDSNSNRVYANMFEILKLKGFNSLRLRLWVDPHDEHGNQYGGGHNDLETTIFIINEAKKYGFNDFLLDFHYSDFWADPGKQYIPKSWKNLTKEELIQKGYDYTYDVLKTIYEKTNVIINRVQYGNEINNGILWWNDSYLEKNYEFTNNFIISAINATKQFESDYSCKIDKSIHFGAGSIQSLINNFKKSIDEVDTIQLSSYVVYGKTLDNLFNDIETLNKQFPDKKIVIGELAMPYTSSEYGYINDGSSGVVNEKKPNYVDYSPEIQALLMYQYMQFLSKLLPNMETGFYWWEIGSLYIGKSAWATKEGILSIPSRNDNWRDVNNWASLTGFDRNGVALPVLDVINYFERNLNDNDLIYKPNEIVNIFNNKDTSKNVYYKNINFSYPSNTIKQDLSKICLDLSGKNASDLDIDINIHVNKYDYEEYLDKYSFNEILNFIVISEIKNEFDSIMYDQVNFSNFKYDYNTKIGEITMSAKDNSFYYKGMITFKFKIHDTYYSNTIDLTNEIIDIDKNSNEWFKEIISVIKNQQNWAFGNQIWNAFGIEGGANDDNEIWLWDKNKYVNRNPEFFLLNNDVIRMYNNEVDFDVLNENKFWIDNFSSYSNGVHEIYFAIKIGLNDIDWEYNTSSTYSQVGKESWKYIDILIYKIKVNLI